MQFKGTGTLLVKDLDTKRGIIQAYWSAFNNIDDGNDIVDPGCWAKSIRERGPQAKQPRIKFLWQHQETMILGKPSELVEDSSGLLATSQIVPTTLGKDCLLLYEFGVISEHSVGYEVVQSRWDPKTGARHLVECVLWEGSACTWGMNSQTPTVSVKALMQPNTLTDMADRAAKLDNLLHNGNLHSDALCETLDRELKALHAALAPADAGQPYTIQGVTQSMNQLADRLGRKAANDDDKKAQEARAKKYGIGIKDGGAVTKPAKYAGLSDDDFADPTNYAYPIDTKAHADNAAARFGDTANRDVYTKDEQAIIDKRIAAAQKKFGEDTSDKDSGKAAPMNRTPKDAQDAQRVRKARDFDTLFQSLADSDQLQDEWGDTFIAFTRAMSELMWQADSVRNGWVPESMAEGFDLTEAAQANVDAFSKAVMDLVQRSDAADFVPSLDYDGDQFLDPDGCNAMEDDEDCYYASRDMRGVSSKGQRNPLAMPKPPAQLRKAGRAISSPNREVITKALDGMSDAMGAMQEHHAAIVDLMKKTDPDAVRQDEATTQGDDDTENGGTNPTKKQRTHAPDRPQAGTTHHRAIFADFDAITSHIGRKAS